MLTNFKVGGYKVFGEVVALNFLEGSNNFQKLSENLTVLNYGNKNHKVLKSLILYGGNNVGKSSLLSAIKRFKSIFEAGNLDNINLELDKNFCFKTDGLIKFEISFISENSQEVTYGIEFANKDAIAEYVFVDNLLLFSKNLDNSFEGELAINDSFINKIKVLKQNKLIVPYFLEFIHTEEDYGKFFLEIKNMFSKIVFYNNGELSYDFKLANDFLKNQKKLNILEKLITTSNLFIIKRQLMLLDDLVKNEYLKDAIDIIKDKERRIDREVLDYMRVASTYVDFDNNPKTIPSFLIDSIGTNKFITLGMYIINAMIDNQILLIDEFDSSLHYKLTRALSIFINSSENFKAQFVLSNHDTKLLSPSLFRKDQIYFITRDEESVKLVSLNMFKSNSNNDIRSDSNFEKMYSEGRIVDLPETDIFAVLEEFKKNE